MKVLNLLLITFTLYSCASFNNPRQIKEEQLDGLKFESLKRYDEARLNSPAQGKDPLSLCHQGDFDEAYEKFKAKLDKNLNNYVYWNKISTCYILQKKYTQAKKFLDLAMSTAKTNTQKSVIINNFGVIQMENQNFHEAKGYFKKSIALDKKALTPRYNLSQIYLRFGLYKNASEEIDLLLKKNTKDVDFLNAKAHLELMQNNYKAALVYFHKIPKSYRGRDDIATNMAMTYLMLGLYDNAQAALDNADKSNSYYLAGQLNISKKLNKRLKK